MLQNQAMFTESQMHPQTEYTKCHYVHVHVKAIMAGCQLN